MLCLTSPQLETILSPRCGSSGCPKMPWRLSFGELTQSSSARAMNGRRVSQALLGAALFASMCIHIVLCVCGTDWFNSSESSRRSIKRIPYFLFNNTFCLIAWRATKKDGGVAANDVLLVFTWTGGTPVFAMMTSSAQHVGRIPPRQNFVEHEAWGGGGGAQGGGGGGRRIKHCLGSTRPRG